MLLYFHVKGERHAIWTNKEMRPFRGGATWHILRVRRKMTKARLFASTLASMYGSILNQTDFAVAPHLMVLRDMPKRPVSRSIFSHVECLVRYPGCFRLTSQSGPKPQPGGRNPRFKKSRAFEYCRLAGTASKRVIRIAVKRYGG